MLLSDYHKGQKQARIVIVDAASGSERVISFRAGEPVTTMSVWRDVDSATSTRSATQLVAEAAEAGCSYQPTSFGWQATPWASLGGRPPRTSNVPKEAFPEASGSVEWLPETAFDVSPRHIELTPCA